ncbi:MAG TPA: rod shape-determining protein MreC [Bryobacteraceae bacterium]|nr:rod shape-determining protein MreC [Bryobacteraceae bacterium]
MEFLLNRFRNLTVLLVVVAAQLILLAYQVKSNQDVRLIRVWAVSAVTPLAKILEVVRRNTIGVVEDYFVLINVREDNRKLNGELGRLKMENQFLKTELQTADRAQALQAFQSRTPSRTIAARIIGSGTGANSKVVFVDRGSGAGIVRGMAVVTPDGIVGKVLASYPTASQVLLITDPTFAAGVISQKNRVHGTLKGTGQNKCIVDYVQNEEKVDVGEVFYTSGDDRVFPKGMPVGTVNVVREGKTFKDIFVVPSGFQNGLEEVLIVIDGIHQAIPEAQAAQSSPEYHILGPPPGDDAGAPAQTSDPKASVLNTDADRLREKYKRMGEAQKHTFGEGLPGSKPPDFNLNPDAKPQKPPVPAAAAAKKLEETAAVGSPVPAVKKPAVPAKRVPTEDAEDIEEIDAAAPRQKPPVPAPGAGSGTRPTQPGTNPAALPKSTVSYSGTPTKRPLAPDPAAPRKPAKPATDQIPATAPVR